MPWLEKINFYFCRKSIKAMNLQSILDPIGDFIVWTFEKVLEPLGELPWVSPNNLVIVLGFVGLYYWLKVQGNYNKKAEKEGGLK